MKQYWLFCFIFLVITYPASGQVIKQTVKGKATDKLTGLPLPGASIKILGAGEFSATTDENGEFSLEAPVGRYKIIVSYTGYKSYHDELLLAAGHQTQLNLSLSQAETILETVEVQSSTVIEELPGLQSISIEKTLRVPANFFDPVRMITSYPGVVATSDQNNSIIVRGNSPNGLLWRLNGLDIVNPNHLANAGTLSDRPAANGGGVNILSAQMLDKTNFYTGAFPARFGNAIAGVIDMNLREGNRSKYGFTAQASLIGLDFAAEGPLDKNERSSFLANYRYSTVGLLSSLGVNFGDETIAFQDFSFHSDFNQKNGGKFSLFGLWGYSTNFFETKDSTEWEEDKDRYNIDFESQTYAFGINYGVPVSNGKFSIGLAYSASAQERLARVSDQMPPFQIGLMSDKFDASQAILSNQIKYETKIKGKTSFELGMLTNYMSNDLSINQTFGCTACLFLQYQELEGQGDGILFQPYFNLSSTFSSFIDITAGLRYLNYTYNNTDAIEPRIGLSLKPNNISGIHLAYSLVGQLQLPQYYFAEGNNNLGLTRAHHMDINYWQHLTEGLKLKTGVFYQNLFDVPIEQSNSSTFSTINLTDGLTPLNLVNDGTGENYGVDATLEKYFFSTSYLLLSGSYYESMYTGGDGIKRDSRFNGNYTFNIVYGKEWTKPAKNRTIGLNTRVLYLGGLRESSVNVLGSRSERVTVYDTTDPFNNKLNDYFRLDIRLSFRKNKPGYTRTFSIDIQNLLGTKNEGYHYFDMTQDKIVTKYQLGIIPVLGYRIDF